jgi:hypothetical protein
VQSQLMDEMKNISAFPATRQVHSLVVVKEDENLWGDVTVTLQG